MWWTHRKALIGTLAFVVIICLISSWKASSQREEVLPQKNNDQYIPSFASFESHLPDNNTISTVFDRFQYYRRMLLLVCTLTSGGMGDCGIECSDGSLSNKLFDTCELCQYLEDIVLLKWNSEELPEKEKEKEEKEQVQCLSLCLPVTEKQQISSIIAMKTSSPSPTPSQSPSPPPRVPKDTLFRTFKPGARMNF